MDFACLILFLLFYFFRPQEWMETLDSFHPIQVFTIVAVFALLARPKGVKPSDLFKTPHDTLVFAYFAWTVIASPSHIATFLTIPSQILFYIICVQSLSNISRINTFLKWWGWSLLVIAALAIASQYGFDPFDSYDLTVNHMKGRLALNLSIYNNPNGLGHTLVPAIPMIYFLLFWKKIIGKISAVLFVLPLWCLYLTESKGSMICAFVTTCATLTFGRPKTVQIAILACAGMFGVGILFALPRMNELEKSTKNDEAIGGRVAAFKFGYDCLSENPIYGIGMNNFQANFFRYGPRERVKGKKPIHGHMSKVWVYRHYTKATHSAYNQNGAELGYPGLMLFIAILYSCMRTLITMPKGSVDQERVRRALFAIVVAYSASSWMVDFAYRPTFFLFVAATGAFQRINLNLGRTEDPQPTFVAPLGRIQPALIPEPQLALAKEGALASPATLPLPGYPSKEAVAEELTAWPPIKWNRIGLIDVGFVLVLTWGAIQFWLYSIRTF